MCSVELQFRRESNADDEGVTSNTGMSYELAERASQVRLRMMKGRGKRKGGRTRIGGIYGGWEGVQSSRSVKVSSGKISIVKGSSVKMKSVEVNTSLICQTSYRSSIYQLA